MRSHPDTIGTPKTHVESINTMIPNKPPAAAALTIEDAFQHTLDYLEAPGSPGRLFLDSLSIDQQLKMYAHFKQIKDGDCDESTPSMWNYKAYRKHQAWDGLRGTSKAQAQRGYVELVIQFSQDVQGLEDLVQKCQGWLDQVHEGDDDNNINASAQQKSEQQKRRTWFGVNEVAANASASPAVPKAQKTTLAVSGILASFCKVLLSDILGIPPLVCRGRLDIANSDLSFAFWQCLRAWNDHTKQQRIYRQYEAKITHLWKNAFSKEHKDPDIVVGLSVRTLLDLYLRVKQYPAGSEIIISPPINVPGVMQVFKHHQLTTVAVDLPHSRDNELLVAVDCDAIDKAVNSKTVAIMIVHVFGLITACDSDFERIREIASRDGRDIDVIEDCAEAFSGIGGARSGSYLGSPYVDVSLYSFGMIKTSTSLNGGVAVIRNQKDCTSKVVEEMHRLHSSCHFGPQQTNQEFLRKVCKGLVLNFIADSPLFYGLIYFMVSRVFTMDFDRLITSLLRGFKLDNMSDKQGSESGAITHAPNRYMRQIRRRPSPAMLALLHRRLLQSSPGAESVRSRVKWCNRLSAILSSNEFDISSHITLPSVRKGCKNFYWLYPVVIDDPVQVSRHFRRRGIDATTGATQLCCIAGSKDPCPRATQLMGGIVYLPLGTCSTSDSNSKEEDYLFRVAKALESFAKSRVESLAPRQRHCSLSMLVVFLPAMLMVATLPAVSRWLVIKLIVVALQAGSCVVLFYLLLVTILRIFIGVSYVQGSTCFAKYSSLLDDPSKHNSLLENHSTKTFRKSTSQNNKSVVDLDSTASAGVLSSIDILKVPPYLNGAMKPRSVFLTGATGFIGSMLMHDLLLHRRTLNIDRVILLCRGKRRKKAEDRIADILDDSMFSFLSPAEKRLLVDVVDGDVTRSDAGVSEDDINRIRETHNVTHVFHCAAAVKFTLSIKDAGASNITASLNVQSLSARLSKSRPQFVYISTAFVHGGLTGDEGDPLPEELYNFGKFDPIEIYNSMCGTQYYAYKAMAELRFPNTYTFSKSVCEHLMVQNDPGMLIIRPSIVGPSVEAPFEGYAGNAPSTIVAAACLYLSYPYNLWSFRPERVPCIPVDVLSRYIIAKAFCTPFTAEAASGVCGPQMDSSSSDDDSFEKISDGMSSSLKAQISSGSSVSSLNHRIFTAAWDDESPGSTSFDWHEFAKTVLQVSRAMSYCGASMVYLQYYLSFCFLPKCHLTIRQFEKLHRWLVLTPFEILVKVCDSLGNDAKALKRLQSFLSLPLLFFHFTDHRFHFRSELVAPVELDGQKYLFICAAAAHQFMRKLRPTDKRPIDDMSFFPIAGSSHHKVPPGLLWAMSQPQGNFFIRVVGWLLTRILHVCYSSVTVDVDSFSPALAAKESGACIILAPTHRSFLDFLLLSYLSFTLPELHVSIPFIAAADEFERLPFVGLIIQYLGAFFIHRGRITRDPAMFETIASVKERSGDTGTIEVFLEGTRSRDRRFGKPKTGVLRCLHGAGGDYIVVPVAISYDRIAEQEVLAHEVEYGLRARLSVRSMISWILRATQGKVHLGRAHIAASEPIHQSNKDCDPDWENLAQQVQQRQAEKILISDYHVDASAKVLDMKRQDVRQAFTTLGVKFFPIDTVDLVLPENDCELLSLFFQAAPYIAPIVRSTKPEWSEWMSRPSCCSAIEEALKDPLVMLVFASLVRLIDSAERCVDETVSLLNQRGFSRPKEMHLLQEAKKCQVNVAASLVRACISIRFSQIEPLHSSVGAVTKTVRKRVGDDECLGFWGFYDSAFVVRTDSDGVPFVTMDGSHYSLRDKRISKLLDFIEAETRMKIDPLNEAFAERDVRAQVCSSCQLSSADLAALKSTVAEVSIVDEDRIRHGTGHCQEDIFHIRSGQFIRVPDAIAWAACEEEVASLVAMAHVNQWCIVPFGGGTNVTQATRCPPIEVEPRPIISLDMRKMNKILWINEENGVAHVEAGILGRHLEEELARHGYTMGHEPDSIEFSTLGGWIATKASGMKRNKYGNIEDMVMSVRVAGPNGLLLHGNDHRNVWGRESCGLDIRSLIFGSEGCLGVVTSAVVRIWPIPEVKDYDSMLFSDFEDGLHFVREVSRLGGDIPASIRLLDNEHFRLGMSLRADASSQMVSMLKAVVSSLIKWKNGFDAQRIVCATITYEGTGKEVQKQKRAVAEIGARHGGVRLGSDVGKSGYDLTFMIAYLRDFAMTYHILGESFETFAPWSKVEAIIENTKARIRKEHSDRHLPGLPFIGSRVTQLYHEGACLYFYFCMNFESIKDASAVYSQIEHAARDEVMANGGSVSHHHGVGKVRSTFLKEVDSLPLQDAMKSLKKGIDPANVFGARNGTFASS